MTTVKINISNKTAVCQKRYLISSNAGYQIKFVFDSEWDVFEVKTARIIFDSRYYDIIFTGDTVELPKIPPCKSLAVGVFTDQLATNAAELGCILSAADFDGEAVTEFTESQYDQIVSLLNQLDFRQIRTIERVDDEVIVTFNDESRESFPLYDGKCATVKIGKVTSVKTPEEASVVNVGTQTEAVLDFCLAQGEVGPVGKTPELAVGTVETVAPDAPASASMTGTAEKPVLNLRIPKGSVGDGEVDPDKTTWMRRVYYNIFDKSTILDGYWFFSAHTADLTGGGTSNHFTTDYIPVLPGKVYRQNVRGNMVIKIFDADKVYTEQILCSNYLISMPENAAYIRFTVSKNDMSADSVQVYEYLGKEFPYSEYKTGYDIVTTDSRYSEMLWKQVVDGVGKGAITADTFQLNESQTLKLLTASRQMRNCLPQQARGIEAASWAISGYENVFDKLTYSQNDDTSDIVTIASGVSLGGKIYIPKGKRDIYRLDIADNQPEITEIVFESTANIHQLKDPSNRVTPFLEKVKMPDIVTNMEYFGTKKGDHFYAKKIDFLGGWSLCGSSLKEIYLLDVNKIGSIVFHGTNALSTLVLAKEDTITTLSSTSLVLDGSPISKGTGYIYVPSALLDEYREATNWVTFADQFRAIEDYPEIVQKIEDIRSDKIW